MSGRQMTTTLQSHCVPLAGAVLAALVAVSPVPAAAEGAILLTVDQARVLRIARPADTVIIGNPAIADATIRDNQTLIITPHSFGTTNLIVLDADGQPIADEILTVQGSEETVVTVFRRSARETLSCTPTCEPTLTVGDEDTRFQALNSQIGARQALSQGGGAQN